MTIAEQMEADYERCARLRVPFNPSLPKKFDSTPNEARPAHHRHWWYRPFIRTETIDRLDAFYRDRTDEYAEAGRKLWAKDRAAWLAAWPRGIRYEVRCLDGGAWDRSTSWGMFATLEEALVCVESGPAWVARARAARGES